MGERRDLAAKSENVAEEIEEEPGLSLPSISKEKTDFDPGGGEILDESELRAELEQLQNELSVRNEALLICEEKMALLSDKLLAIYKAHEFLQTENTKLKQELSELSDSVEENTTHERSLVQQKLAKVNAKANSYQERAQTMETTMRDLMETVKSKDRESQRLQKQVEQLEARLARANEAVAKDREAFRASELARKEQESEVRTLKAKIAMQEKEKERPRRASGDTVTNTPKKSRSAPPSLFTPPPGSRGSNAEAERKRMQKTIDRLRKENEKLSKLLESKPKKRSAPAEHAKTQPLPASQSATTTKGRRAPDESKRQQLRPKQRVYTSPRETRRRLFNTEPLLNPSTDPPTEEPVRERGLPDLRPGRHSAEPFQQPQVPDTLQREMDEAKRAAFMFPDLVAELRKRVSDLESKLVDQDKPNPKPHVPHRVHLW